MSLYALEGFDLPLEWRQIRYGPAGARTPAQISDGATARLPGSNGGRQGDHRCAEGSARRRRCRRLYKVTASEDVGRQLILPLLCSGGFALMLQSRQKGYRKRRTRTINHCCFLKFHPIFLLGGFPRDGRTGGRRVFPGKPMNSLVTAIASSAIARSEYHFVLRHDLIHKIML